MFLTRPFDYILIRLIVVTTIVRSMLAFALDLGNDEVYYFTYAVQPDWNHFDHPPLLGLFIRLFTLNLFWIDTFSMRLPAIIGAAINTWLIAQCGQLIKGKRAGLIAALLYNTSVYTSVISGLFILPDSVQLIFWLAALYSMLSMTSAKSDSVRNFEVLKLGLWIGLAMLCKVHGVFLWFGFFGYIVLYQRNWLKNPYLYLSVATTVLLISPIIFWNVGNDFITWRFHSERVQVNGARIDPVSLLTTTIGQIAYNNPIHIVIYVVTAMAAIRHDNPIRPSTLRLLLWCSLPIIIATTCISAFRATLPHWSGPGFIGLMLLAASVIDQHATGAHAKGYRRLLYAAAGLMLFVVVAGTALIHLYPGTLSGKPEPETGTGDATLDLFGWDELAPAFESIRKEDSRAHVMKPDSPLLIHRWFPGGHLYFYVAYPLHIRMIGSGPLNDLHKFHWLNAIYGHIPQGGDAYYISPSNYFTDPFLIYGADFQAIELAKKVKQYRNGKIARYWYIYRLKNAKSVM